MSVVTRFAPSPTGFLHIGGARTALFNWLFARHHGGTYLLRVEDTDKKRSTPEAIAAINDGLNWLGLQGDGETIFQSAGESRHRDIAEQLVREGKAYHCYCTPEELQAMRETAMSEGKPMRYDGRWRDAPASDAPDGIKPSIRIKAPQKGSTTIHDLVQGEVTVPNSDLDDMIILRSDGTPTYMLAVVVDDHDMGITHVIRGDDHLTNAFRQVVLFDAMDWPRPEFAHIPLIHGADGAKLSKRHGALGVDAYRDMGYTPQALRNYLLRLGWSHGDEEIISLEDAIKWFDLGHVGKSPSRMDFDKMKYVNAHYVRHMSGEDLLEHCAAFFDSPLTGAAKARLINGLPALTQRISTLDELAKAAIFYAAERPLPMEEKAKSVLDTQSIPHLNALTELFNQQHSWIEAELNDIIQAYVSDNELKFKQVGLPLRAALTGSTSSPSVPEVMVALGKNESIARLNEALEFIRNKHT